MGKRVREHDSTLCDPKEGSAETEDSTRGDDKRAVTVVVVVQERASVEGISPATEDDGTDTDKVEDGLTDKETSRGTDREESDRGVGADLRHVNIKILCARHTKSTYRGVKLATATHT